MKYILILLIIICFGCNNYSSSPLNNKLNIDTSTKQIVPDDSKLNHCINTKWDVFGDKQYYRYIKTLNSGMKLYRYDNDEGYMIEVYVLNGLIKIQAISILTNDKEKMLEELDAFIIKANPISVEGNLYDTKIYKLNRVEVMVKNNKNSVFYMVSEKER